MKSLQYLFFAALFLIFSCSHRNEERVLKVKLIKLKKSDIYNADLVYDMLFDAEEMNIDSLKKRSRLLFLKGVDLYKNEKNPRLAINKFKESILVLPDAKTYYELGNALFDAKLGEKSVEESLKAYQVAKVLNFQPVAQITFKEACAYYQIYKYDLMRKDENAHLWSVMNSLEETFSNGLFDTLMVKNDPVLAGIEQEALYKGLVIKMLAKNLGDNNSGLFNVYMHSFATDVSNLEILPQQVDMSQYRQPISYDFASYIPEMQNTSFGRDVSNDYYYVGKVKETPIYTAVLYSSITFTGADMQPVYTNLVVYSKTGEILSKKMIACQCSATKIKCCKIDDGKVTVEEFKRNWEKPITEVGFRENKIKDYESLAKAIYIIDDSGNIIAEDVPKGYNDSTIFAEK
ncbi:MAG: hypothetical protein EAY81_10210 [Bacteroidetes bacterium]|nr:MAG: hypothetical protein EAY81_10210 [Bacteroidota bacterium]